MESIVNEHASIKRKRVRKNDVPYMTKEWKIAIRNKKKYAVRFAKNRTQENFELKKKYRNLATKERRKAIQEYWHKKTEEMHDKPASFFKAFKPFLKESNKQTTHLNLRIDRAVVTDQAEHSCETTLLSMLEEWKLAIDRRELVCILSTDMGKAFDSLCPSLILKKLEAYGFTEQALELMRSYFEDRLNRVKIGNTTSE